MWFGHYFLAKYVILILSIKIAIIVLIIGSFYINSDYVARASPKGRPKSLIPSPLKLRKGGGGLEVWLPSLQCLIWMLKLIISLVEVANIGQSNYSFHLRMLQNISSLHMWTNHLGILPFISIIAFLTYCCDP